MYRDIWLYSVHYYRQLVQILRGIYERRLHFLYNRSKMQEDTREAFLYSHIKLECAFCQFRFRAEFCPSHKYNCTSGRFQLISMNINGTKRRNQATLHVQIRRWRVLSVWLKPNIIVWHFQLKYTNINCYQNDFIVKATFYWKNI